MPESLLKKRLWHSCFHMNLKKFLRTPFLQNTPGRLLLYQSISKFIDNLYLKPQAHSLSFNVPIVVIRCHSLSFIRCHLLSLVVPLVVIRCTTRCHTLLLVVTQYTTCLYFYKRSFNTVEEHLYLTI